MCHYATTQLGVAGQSSRPTDLIPLLARSNTGGADVLLEIQGKVL